MAIQIIDGFQVNIASPIDNRIVASGSAARNAIPYKYHGLRVFDISNNIPYVWNGASWVSENASGIVGSGTAEYIPLYTSSNVISNSLLYQYNGIIKTADNGNGADLAQIDPEYGTVYAQGGFYGPGSSITNISATNITTGTLPLSRLQGVGSTGQIIVAGVTTPSWTNQSQLSVGTASVAVNATQVSITGTDASSTERYLTFIDTINISPVNNIVKANTTLRFKPSTGQLLINSGAVATPGIGIIGTTNTGIYKYSTSGLGITVAGSEKASFNTDGIRHVNTTFSNPGNIPSFLVGTGNLTRATQITIASVTYDRVIYVYSSSNENNYYSTSGFFEIEIYIINGGVNQQIYTIFHGNDSDIRPTGIGYNYILPAGSSSTISLYKGNSLAWNAGSGPTIYAKSLKFGL
jgi:hypothetical protein